MKNRFKKVVLASVMLLSVYECTSAALSCRGDSGSQNEQGPNSDTCFEYFNSEQLIEYRKQLLKYGEVQRPKKAVSREMSVAEIRDWISLFRELGEFAMADFYQKKLDSFLNH